MSDVVLVNVGGVVFATTRSTLRGTDESTYFAAALRADPACTELFVDRDPTWFRHILNWMRGARHLPDDEAILGELRCEADYYCLADMKAALQHHHGASVPRVLNAMLLQLRVMRG